MFEFKSYVSDRMICTDSLLKKLRKLGIDTDGYVNSLEKFLKTNNFNLPGYMEEKNETYYGFRHNEQVRLYLNYADALAEEIIFIHEFKLI